jgi:hypothetical protein
VCIFSRPNYFLVVELSEGPQATALEANLPGVGGIQDPTKVLVIVATDVRVSNKQLSRMVCTPPEGEANLQGF